MTPSSRSLTHTIAYVTLLAGQPRLGGCRHRLRAASHPSVEYRRTKAFDDPNWHDDEIGIKPSASSSWVFAFDHVSNVRVQQGQTVSAGEWIADRGNGSYELMLSQDAGAGNGTIYCSLDFVSAEFQAEAWGKITHLMADYESYLSANNVPISSGDGITDPAQLYDEATMVTPGCRVATYKD